MRHTGRFALSYVVLAAFVLLGAAKCSLFNKAPAVPTVAGPTEGVAGVAVTFTATTVDPDEDSTSVMFDWGDNSMLEWTVYLASGAVCTTQHTYADSGTFTIKARAKDKSGKESDWSAGQAVGMHVAGPAYPDSLVYDVDLEHSVISFMATPNAEYAIVGQDRWGIRVIETSGPTVHPAQTLMGKPRGMTMSPDGSFAVVGCSDTDAIVLLRPPWDSVAATLLLPDDPLCLGITRDGHSALVGQLGSHSIFVVELPGLTIVDTIQLSDAPLDLAVSPDGSKAYAALSTGIAAVDLALRQQTGTIVPEIAGGLVRVTPDGGSLLLSSRADSGFCVIDVSSGQLLRTVNLHHIVMYDLQATPDGGYHVATDVNGAKYVSAATGMVVDSLVTAAGTHIALAVGGSRLFLAGGGHFYMFIR